jgi:hypothetical protein
MFLTKPFQVQIWTFFVIACGVFACPDYSQIEDDPFANYTTLDPRWYTISDVGEARNPWPSSTLPYCFENDDARNQLAGILLSGWKIWQTAYESLYRDLNRDLNN